MKNLFFVSFCILFFHSCGTTGHIKFYNFQLSKGEVETEIKKVINKDSVHSVPPKWSDVYESPGPIEYIYLYFEAGPEEMYKIGFTNREEWKSSATCQLGLVGAFKEREWHFKKDLSRDEQRRIEARFEKEVLSKLRFPYSKDD